MLEIKNITVRTTDDNKLILDKFSLTIPKGEIHVIMGPNGVGKSTLSKVIMGNYKYKVTKGDILFKKKSILDKSTEERAKLGLFVTMQDPIAIDGVKLSEFLKTALREKEGDVNLYDFINSLDDAAHDLKMDPSMLHRSLNKSFSGGERKKSEVLQLKVLKPEFIILDELDSGLDIDSLKLVCKNINDYLKENSDTAVLIITHYPRILEYIKPDRVHILLDGQIKKSGDRKLAEEIESSGYLSINEVEEAKNYE
ncbi:MAG: Fe-S cluster assembly ATPase SufC [Bacilli bacterium]|nr:Fe-S cluster assembly ATPase SufC [Bacilli bacterium]